MKLNLTHYGISSIQKLAMTGALVLSFAAFGAAQTTTNDNSAANANTGANAATSTQDTGAKTARGEGWKALNLSADQKTQIKSIREDARKQMQAVKSDTSLSKEQKKAKMKDIHEDTTSKINALLTPEQQQKFAQMQANHKKRHKRAEKENNG